MESEPQETKTDQKVFGKSTEGTQGEDEMLQEGPENCVSGSQKGPRKRRGVSFDEVGTGNIY